jgi:hypothetical protein
MKVKLISTKDDHDYAIHRHTVLIKDDKITSLSEMAELFKAFMLASGFDYIKEVVFIKNGDTDEGMD